MNLLKHAKNIRDLKNDPVGFIIDSIISILINLVIPIPLVGKAVAQFRAPVLGCLGSIIILGVFMIMVVGTIFMSPLMISSGFFRAITSFIPSESTNFPNGNLIQTSSPRQTPLGGNSFEYVNITAGFKDPAYYLKFGKVHFGIDLVPNNAYYTSNQSYKDTHKVIVYATHSGKITYYIDSYGSETVEVLNDDSSLKTIYMHMKEVFVKSGETAKAGTPLGEMGKTGFATAEHIHYEIRIKDDNTWLAVNPLTYIK